MPRKPRQPSKTQIYHIMLRGNEKKDIFRGEKDKLFFLDVINKKKKNNEFRMYACCIMDNHAHLLLKEEKESISQTMKRIGITYAYYYNNKHKRIGHVFQDRYKSEKIEDDKSLLSVTRYIHNNPEKAGICNKEHYQWSSFNAYIMEDNHFFNLICDRISIEEILNMFSPKKREAIRLFKSFSNNLSNSDQDHIDIEEDEEGKNFLTESEVEELMQSFLFKKKVNKEDLMHRNYRHIRIELILNLKNRTNYSLRKIAQVTGLSRETVRKAFVSEEPSP